jgi:endonuclease/exonuclease/phosphatase family metal-dependent hydrolase
MAAITVAATSSRGAAAFKRRSRAERARRGVVPGRIELVVFSRLPILHTEIIKLKRRPRDGTARRALVVVIEVAGTPVSVVGTHLSHLSQASPLQMRELRRLISTDRPTVLAGDMNAWRWVLRATFPDWAVARSSATWPSWKPRHQIDHVLTRGPLSTEDVTVVPLRGSDHLPLRATIVVG